MKAIKVFAALCGTVLMSALFAAPEDPLLPIYVDPVNGSDDNNGHTWETAMKTISAANMKTEEWAYWGYRRCQIVLRKGTYVLDSKITLMSRTSLAGDPDCGRDETVLTAPDSAVCDGFLEFGDSINGDFARTVSNLTISNVTMAGGAPLKCGTQGGTWYAKVVSNVVVTCCHQKSEGVCSAGVLADGYTYVIGCEFSHLTSQSGWGTAATCMRGGWFKDCVVQHNDSVGGGQISVFSNEWNPFSDRCGLEDCVFHDNTAIGNGGCFVNMPLVKGCTFKDNETVGIGGAGYCFDEYSGYFASHPPRVIGCTFSGNTGTGNNCGCGALYFACGGMVSNCTFVGNGGGAGSRGGAIFFEKPGCVDNCHFTNNFASVGGAITASAGAFPVVVRASEFVGNRSTLVLTYDGYVGGGAVYNAAEVRDSLFAGNEAHFDGGALFWDAPMSFTVSNCVFASNVARRSGGAAATSGDLVLSDSMIVDCVVTNNRAGGSGDYRGGAGLCLWTGGSASGSAVTVRNCLIANNSLTNEVAEACGSGAILMARGGGSIVVESCTIVDNRTSCGNVSPIYVWPDVSIDGHTYLTNTLVAKNVGAGGAFCAPMTSVYGLTADMRAKVGYSYLQPAVAGEIDAASHVISTNAVPRFAEGSYVPQRGFLGRDAGLNQQWMSEALDLRGRCAGGKTYPRVYNGVVDIGAYEYYPSGLGFVLSLQ